MQKCAIFNEKDSFLKEGNGVLLYFRKLTAPSQCSVLCSFKVKKDCLIGHWGTYYIIIMCCYRSLQSGKKLKYIYFFKKKENWENISASQASIKDSLQIFCEVHHYNFTESVLQLFPHYCYIFICILIFPNYGVYVITMPSRGGNALVCNTKWHLFPALFWGALYGITYSSKSWHLYCHDYWQTVLCHISFILIAQCRQITFDNL